MSSLDILSYMLMKKLITLINLSMAHGSKIELRICDDQPLPEILRKIITYTLQHFKIREIMWCNCLSFSDASFCHACMRKILLFTSNCCGN